MWRGREAMGVHTAEPAGGLAQHPLSSLWKDIFTLLFLAERIHICSIEGCRSLDAGWPRDSHSGQGNRNTEMLFWGIWVGRKAELVCSWSSLLVSTSNAHMSAGTCLPFENSSQVLVCADRGQRPFHTVRTHLLLMQLLLHPPPMPCKLSQLTAGNTTSLPLLHCCPAQPPSASPERPLHSASHELYPPPSLYYLDIKWIADYWRSVSKRETYFKWLSKRTSSKYNPEQTFIKCLSCPSPKRSKDESLQPIPLNNARVSGQIWNI